MVFSSFYSDPVSDPPTDPWAPDAFVGHELCRLDIDPRDEDGPRAPWRTRGAVCALGALPDAFVGRRKEAGSRGVQSSEKRESLDLTSSEGGVLD